MVRISLPHSAQQQIGRAGAAMAGLGRRHSQHMLPELRLLQPARNRTLEDSRPIGSEASTGDDQDAAASGVARTANKRGERPMSLGLRHSVQVETCLDLVQTTFQSLRICPVDPGEAIKRQWRI